MVDTVGPHDIHEARRRLGQQLAALRKAAGHTQHSLAPLTLYGRSTIANAETGHQRPDRTFWQRRDEILHTDGILTTGYDRIVALEREYRRVKVGAIQPLPAAAMDNPPPAVVTVPGTPGALADDTVIVAIVVDGRARQVCLSRRALLQALSGSVAASVVGVNAGHAVDGGRVDPAIVEHFAMLRAVLVESDNQVGAEAILPTARQQLSHIAAFRRAAGGDLRDALLATEARWAEFASWLSDDLGDRAAGDWWLGQALAMSQEADDEEFTTYVFARMAQRAAEAIDRDRVLGLARAAVRSGAAKAQVRAFAAVQRAHGHAIAGDVVAFQAAVDDAQRLVVGIGGDDSGLGSFCTTPYVWAQEGDGWLRLGRPRAAVRCFETALDAWPESYRRERGLYLARTAAAYAAAGEPQQAAGTALTALELARLTRSARVQREVAAVGSSLAAFPTEPGVAELHAALAVSAAT